MSGHLCLKWNNHSSAFLKNISHIQIKEKYCDATIACQGKYFPVHRVILSTCSDYFDDIFERMQCQHPYIVFKDIEPREMELLLNYMYQGEVNVVQEMLPTLIKAAEALRIKGLAVPDDLPTGKESNAKKRSCSSSDNPLPKRRSEEGKRKRRSSSELNPHIPNSEEGKTTNVFHENSEHNQAKLIKEEPPDTDIYAASLPPPEFNDGTATHEDTGNSGEEPLKFVNFPMADNDTPPYIKSEDNLDPDDPSDEQSANWSDYASGSNLPELPPSQITGPDAMSRINRGVEGEESILPDTSRLENCVLSLVERKHTNTPMSLFQCHYCNYRSYVKSHVKRHMMFKHTGERPHPCRLCPRRFTEKIALERHMRTHTGEKPFECTVCSRRFSLNVNLRRHQEIKHQMIG